MNLSVIIIIVLGVAGFTSAIIAFLRWKRLSKNIYIDDKIVSKRRRYMNFTIAGMLLMLSMVLFLKFRDTETDTSLDLWIDAGWTLGLLGYLLDSYYNASIVKKIDSLCLYLRPFSIDMNNIVKNKKSYVKGWLGIKEPIEKLLCDELNQKVSQTFSIGNPNSSLPVTFATTNLYAKDSEWKDTVAELSEKAEVIVIRVGESEGCLWEVNHCAEKRYLQKTVFLIENNSMIDLIKSKIEEIGPMGFDIDRNPKNILALFFDKQKGQWQATELKSRRIIRRFVTDYIENDISIKNQSLAQKKRDRVIQTIFKPGRIPGRAWQTLGFALNPIGYCLFNRWPKKWWLLFMANMLLAFMLALPLSYFAYFIVHIGDIVAFENLTQAEQDVIFDQLIDSDSFWKELLDGASVFTVLLMTPWIWLAPNVSWRSKRWGSKTVFRDRNRSFTTWTVLFLLFFFLFFMLCVMLP